MRPDLQILILSLAVQSSFSKIICNKVSALANQKYAEVNVSVTNVKDGLLIDLWDIMKFDVSEFLVSWLDRVEFSRYRFVYFSSASNSFQRTK